MTYTLNLSTKVLTIHEDGLTDLVIGLGADAAPDKMQFWVGTDRFLEIFPGGGHWQIDAMGSLTAKPASIEVNSTGHVLIHEE